MGHAASTPSLSLVSAPTSATATATTSSALATVDSSMASFAGDGHALPPLPTETDGATDESAVTHIHAPAGFARPEDGGGSMVTVSRPQTRGRAEEGTHGVAQRQEAGGRRRGGRRKSPDGGTGNAREAQTQTLTLTRRRG